MGIWGDLGEIGSTLEKWTGAAVDNVEGVAKYGVNTAKGVVGGVEDTFEIPLLLIAGGIALFLWKSGSPDNVKNIASSAVLFA